MAAKSLALQVGVAAACRALGGGPPTPRPLQDRRCGLPAFEQRRLRICTLSRLNHAACTLCVYASQPGSLPDHATRDSGWWPALTGQGFHLLGRVEGFRHVCPSTWLPPSPSFAWRNQIWCTAGCSCGGSAVLDELYSVVERDSLDDLGELAEAAEPAPGFLRAPSHLVDH